LSEYFQHYGCPLCGEVHELRLHGYPSRLVRSHETFENEEIRICVIYCATAKKQGWQYTKRILPPFVIPECNINLEQVLLMYAQNQDGPVDLEAACELLGTTCEKTIRRHFRMVAQMLEATVSDLATEVALEGPFVGLPDGEKPRSLWWLFRRLKKAVEQVVVERGGQQGAADGADSWYVHSVYVRIKWRGGRRNSHNPSKLSWRRSSFFDTG